MGKIKQLSALEAQKIAAGEVVERPANIVKELLENALDAGATSITMYIKDGGKKSIRIVDNGCGMAPDDARDCFLHHATSKITSVDTLSSVQTFGFRGEALSSIASVSKVRLLTKDADEQLGTLLHLEGGQIVHTDQQPCNTGTDITIEDLFFNVPARFKFLKTRDTEWRQILLLFHAFALSYPQVHFTLEHDDSLVFNCPVVQSLHERVAQLYDRQASQHMLTLEQPATLQVSGMISNHQYYKYDRSHLFVFVNRRWIKNFKIISAIIKGYSHVLPEGKYPVCALFIDIEPDQIDVNVHPRKEEVQFLHPRTIEQTITQQVKLTLEQAITRALQVTASRPAVQMQSQQPLWTSRQLTAAEPIFSRTPSLFVHQDTAVHKDSFPTVEDHQQNYEEVQQQQIDQQLARPAFEQQEMNDEMSEHVGTLIGQYNKTYLLLEKEAGLYLIDQHAAHERIMYEQFTNTQSPVESVSLLFPQTVTLSTEQIDILEQYFGLLQSAGIAIERFGSDTCMINALPVYLKAVDCSAIITDLLRQCAEHAHVSEQEFQRRITNALYAQMACKAAVKAGDVLSHEQMISLITTLSRCNNRLTCPHGRPTGWFISLYEIEKKFKRKL